MIHDLDDTLKALLQTYAPGNSLLASATISFDLPDLDWRNQQQQLTLNCYLYDVRQNMTLRTDETLVVRSADDTRATRIRPPVRIDCAYCITAWSAAQTPLIAEEHRLLGDVLRLLVHHRPFGCDQDDVSGPFRGTAILAVRTLEIAEPGGYSLTVISGPTDRPPAVILLRCDPCATDRLAARAGEPSRIGWLEPGRYTVLFRGNTGPRTGIGMRITRVPDWTPPADDP